MLRLNPLSGIIEGFRDAIFGRPFNLSGLGISAGNYFRVLLLAAGICIQTHGRGIRRRYLIIMEPIIRVEGLSKRYRVGEGTRLWQLA